MARIWRARNLQPWRVDTFKISNDPDFEAKLVDVVGLYLNPPERAVVFSFDEKTQCQALDRTQPSLPMKPGRAGTMTHDYKRNGTTDLFAALNVATGEVLYDTRRHTARPTCSAFFKLIDLHVPRDLEVHVVLDNLSAHKAPPVAEWLAHPKRPAGICTSRRPASSWLNLVEGWFALLTEPAAATRQLQLRRRPHRRHRDCGLDTGTTTPQPFVWHKTAEEDHRQGPARTSRPDPPDQIRDGPLAMERWCQVWEGAG